VEAFGGFVTIEAALKQKDATMNHEKSLQHMIMVGLVILLSVGCSAPATISGKLIGPDSDEPIGPHGPIAEAQIYLKAYQDEDCVKLAESTQELSDQEKKQLEDCAHDDASSTTSDTEGRYEFPEIGRGWYSLVIEWELREPPNVSFGFILEFRDGFFVAVLETKETPKRYIARAVQDDIFYFSGQKSMVIDFDYNKK
jgi:hypothetical protein